MKRVLLFVLLAASVVFSGCKTRATKLPMVSGKAGEIYVIAEKPSWDGAFGNAVREVLASDCPFLPQSEPLYDLTNITPSNFTNMFKIHRNLIITYVSSDVTEPKMELHYNVFAQPQIVVYLTASSSEDLTKLFKQNSEKILFAFEQQERDRILANTIKYQEPSLHDLIKEEFGADMYFPSGYRAKKISHNFIWITYEPNNIQQCIFLYRYPATNHEIEFSKDNLIAARNEIMKTNVPGMFENTYLTTSVDENGHPLADVRYLKYKGRSFAEMRGLWDVKNDYMGGPFVSHSFYSPDGKEVIAIEAFVYAPKYDKRHFLRQVESILYSYSPIVAEEKEEK
ncbi:MAG: DUF4837 family protein [Bacteroidales bacterium]|nr:DUF4837 family protein [Bacteroidales bacterium]